MRKSYLSGILTATSNVLSWKTSQLRSMKKKRKKKWTSMKSLNLSTRMRKDTKTTRMSLIMKNDLNLMVMLKLRIRRRNVRRMRKRLNAVFWLLVVTVMLITMFSALFITTVSFTMVDLLSIRTSEPLITPSSLPAPSANSPAATPPSPKAEA